MAEREKRCVAAKRADLIEVRHHRVLAFGHKIGVCALSMSGSPRARRRPGDRGRQRRCSAPAPGAAFDLIYIDPPFNTGRAQTRALDRRPRPTPRPARVGFGGRRYRSELLQALGYDDASATTSASSRRGWSTRRDLLAPHGTLYFHIDYREAHYCKLLLDELFGRDAFLNEIIWAYDYGAKPRRRWPAKHDTILVYVRTPGAHHFDADAVEREPYMAPGLVAPRRPRAASARPTSGFTRSCRPTAPRRPATRRRSRRGSCGGWSPHPRGRAAGAWILRRLGDARRGRRAARAPLRAGRLEPGRRSRSCAPSGTPRLQLPLSTPARARAARSAPGQSACAAARPRRARPAPAAAARADRRNQPPAWRELRLQRRGNRGRRPRRR